jgi:hypothetical protein
MSVTAFNHTLKEMEQGLNSMLEGGFHHDFARSLPGVYPALSSLYPSETVSHLVTLGQLPKMINVCLKKVAERVRNDIKSYEFDRLGEAVTIEASTGKVISLKTDKLPDLLERLFKIDRNAHGFFLALSYCSVPERYVALQLFLLLEVDRVSLN